MILKNNLYTKALLTQGVSYIVSNSVYKNIDSIIATKIWDNVGRSIIKETLIDVRDIRRYRL